MAERRLLGRDLGTASARALRFARALALVSGVGAATEGCGSAPPTAATTPADTATCDRYGPCCGDRLERQGDTRCPAECAAVACTVVGPLAPPDLPV